MFLSGWVIKYGSGRRLAGACELHLFAGVDGGEDVGEVLLRVLGADLQDS